MSKNFPDDLEQRDPQELNYNEALQVSGWSLLILFGINLVIAIILVMQDISEDNVYIILGGVNILFALFAQPMLIQKTLAKKSRGIYHISFWKALVASIAGLIAGSIIANILPVGIIGLLVYLFTSALLVQKFAHTTKDNSLDAKSETSSPIISE